MDGRALGKYTVTLPHLLDKSKAFQNSQKKKEQILPFPLPSLQQGGTQNTSFPS